MLKKKLISITSFSLPSKVGHQADSRHTAVCCLDFMMPVGHQQSFGIEASVTQFWLACSVFNLAANRSQSLMLNEQLHWSQ